MSGIATIRLIFAALAALSLLSSTAQVAICEQQHRETIRVALFLDAGAHPRPQLISSFNSQPDMNLKEVTGLQVREGCLKDFDVLVVPGGSGKAEANSLEQQGRDEIRKFVAHGGCYLGICAGCYLASTSKEYLALLPLKALDRSHWRRGRAWLPIEFTAMGSQIFGISKRNTHVIYHNGPVLGAIDEQGSADVNALAYFRDEKVAPGGQEGIMIGSPAMVLSKYGQGLVIGISPHPELTPGMENLEPNAARWLYQHRNQP